MLTVFNRLRRSLYSRNIFPSYRCLVPVLSVGNIAFGGTGKTPLIDLLLSNISIANTFVLSRGYRSHSETSKLPILVHPEDARCGDEVRMLAKKHPHISFYSGKDRVAAAKLAVANGARLIILDDGMQHLRLFRDIDICVIDANDPFPRLMREEKAALSHAHWIAISNVKDEIQFSFLEKVCGRYSKARCFGFVSEPSQIFEKPTPAGAFCGIAKPDAFLQTLEKANARVVAFAKCPDHVLLSPDRLTALCHAAQAKGAQTVLCTEKDFIKLGKGWPLVQALCLSTHICAGQDAWNRLLEKVNQ